MTAFCDDDDDDDDDDDRIDAMAVVLASTPHLLLPRHEPPRNNRRSTAATPQLAESCLVPSCTLCRTLHCTALAFHYEPTMSKSPLQPTCNLHLCVLHVQGCQNLRLIMASCHENLVEGKCAWACFSSTYCRCHMPRTPLPGFHHPPQERSVQISSFLNARSSCLPCLWCSPA